MSRIRVHSIAVSLDGFGAGPDQSLEAPLGTGGERLHTWVFDTRKGREMLGEPGGSEGVDERFLRAGDAGIGATILGRNMFGPVRGPWPDESWVGWWGPKPPYGHLVFVLTHHERPSVTMAGGTTFVFVTDGIESALKQARAAAGGLDVRIGGGAATIRQFLAAGLVDELHIAIVPILLGAGERIFDGDSHALDGYRCVEVTASSAVAHLRFERAAEG